MEEPTSGATFLSRYRAARTPSTETVAAPSAQSAAVAATPKSPAPTSPKAVPAARPSAQVWGSVFHPGGRSPTTGSRYETPTAPGLGESASEMHDAGVAGMVVHGRIED